MSILSFDVGIKNLAYCILKKDTNEIVAWSVVDIPIVLSNQLQFFDNCDFWKYPFDCVIIEKQPAQNIKMRMLENTLNVYFILKNIPNVSTFSSKHKLGSIGKETKGKHNYLTRKKYGIAMTKVYLETSSFEEFFFKHKKKDDLSDCLLQALAYNKYNVDSLQSGIITL